MSDHKPVAHLSLICTNIVENKYRAYSIEVRQYKKNYQVRCAWGRLKSQKRQLLKSFDDQNTMLHFIEQILKRRYRNDYQIIAQSDDFPETPSLKLLPYTDHIAGQLLLF
ncbi:MAG: WGR domain-containing protein [Bacteroidota bacterium]